jgi:hypothetical protein
MGKKRAAYKALVGKPKGNRPLGKPNRGWEDKMDLQEVGWGAGTGLIWLGTGAGDGLLLMQPRTFECHKMWRIS